MLSSAIDYYDSDPMYMVIPGVAIFITVLAFNLYTTDGYSGMYDFVNLGLKSTK
ncbi:hypothetical protein STENM327S_07891 [Streptomyces tendae]